MHKRLWVLQVGSLEIPYFFIFFLKEEDVYVTSCVDCLMIIDMGRKSR